MEFDRMYLLLFLLLPTLGFTQDKTNTLPYQERVVHNNIIRVYTHDLACENQTDTIVVQVLTDPFDDFFLDVATELEKLTHYMDSREKKYCPIYYDEIGKKDEKLILNVAFGSSEW